MEAGVIGEMRAEIRHHEARLDALHTSIGTIRGTASKNSTSISVITKELESIREDISELKDSVKWVLRGLFGAIAVGIGVIISIVTLILQIT